MTEMKREDFALVFEVCGERERALAEAFRIAGRPPHEERHRHRAEAFFEASAICLNERLIASILRGEAK